ncbi:serine-arginine protein 55-like [Metopolophium dirhodum]|uniref:serine-arginine protein 55-like n=1 Tax=Metopolophium dirhodum TaxID=44670 RepID=UPI00299060B1|nr:serine-arginine protein 55-like [Metopolophium dirhodum]
MSNGFRVFVGGLSHCISERDLSRFFQKIGRVKDIAMKNGYAFVEFHNYRDVDDAVYELNGCQLNGKRVTVERARGTPRGSDVWRGLRRGGDLSPSPPRRPRRDSRDDRNDRYGPPIRTNYRLIVENLSSCVSWQDLKDFMRQAGEVTYADAHNQRKNEGVVEFASYLDLKNALDKLDDTELNGRHVRLLEDRSISRGRGGGRRSRSPSSSRTRSHRRVRSRSRSRSRSHSKSKFEPRSKSPYKYVLPAHSKLCYRSGSIDKKRSQSC